MFDFLELTQGLIEKNDFEETEFQPLPVGDYRVKVANVEKKTSQSGNDYVSMVMEVIDGDFTGRNIYNNFFLSVKTAEASIKRNMQKVLNKMGATIDEKEINFYMAFHHINPKIQRRLVNDFFAKEFSGHNDLKNVTKRQYITLMVCLKKYLLGLGYIYLPLE